MSPAQPMPANAYHCAAEITSRYKCTRPVTKTHVGAAAQDKTLAHNRCTRTLSKLAQKRRNYEMTQRHAGCKRTTRRRPSAKQTIAT
eukprot:4311284-Pyramimonas_sp.AAC.1